MQGNRERLRVKAIAARTLMALSLWLGVAAPAYSDELYLSAASSLKEVVTELMTSYALEHGPQKFVASFGASGILAKQIENGAPADLFIAANAEWISCLTKNGRLSHQLIPMAYNSLVFAGKAELGVSRLADITRLSRIAIGSPRSVPAGEYALAALKKAGLMPALENKLVLAKDARECLMYAERGEVDGALVYRTDALLLGKRTQILFMVEPEFHERIGYPLALTKTGAGKREALDFFGYLQSPAAKFILTRYGFAVP